MNPILTYLVATLLASAGVAAVSLPFFLRLSHRIGLIDAPGHRKIHDQPVTLAGGLSLLTALVSLACVWWLASILNHNGAFTHQLATSFTRDSARFLAIAAGALAMFTIGLFDDRFELQPAAKFLCQLGVATAVALSGVRCGLFESQPSLQIPLTVLWILTVTNAFNFIDNMNGLCAGLCLAAALTTATIAAQSHELLTATIATALAGAALGFLPFNYPKASAFLGDSGSHLIGFTLATLTIHPALWHSSTDGTSVTVIGPALLLAVPLVDLVWVVFYRTWIGKPFYVGDDNHLSHQLVRRGLPRPLAVALLWAASVIACLLAVHLH